MISIDPRSRVPIYQQIIDYVKEMSLSGVLKPNEKLPSVRELSSMITINPNTIQKAYQELERQGIIYIERGKGTYVAENVKVPNYKKTLNEIEEELRKIIVECIYLDLTKEEIIEKVKNIYYDLQNQKNEVRK